MHNVAKHTHVLLALAIVLASTVISGQTLSVMHTAESSGTLDASFGTDGKVTTDFAGASDVVRGVAVQPDGKVLAAGSAVINGVNDLALARYNSDGTLDSSFGTAGTVTTDFAGAGDQAFALAVQPDGKIVAAGSALINGVSDFALARYNSDGTLDASFGTGGTVTTDFAGAGDQAFSLVVQPNGKIVAVGNAAINGVSDFALARYNSDGTLDASFGTGGTVTTNFAGGLLTQAFSVALQPNGKIVAAGQTVINGSFDFALARYNSDGTLDSSFGTGGTLTTDFEGSLDRARSVAVQANGKVVAAGQAVINGSVDFALTRYDSDGTLDSSFGTGGRVTTSFFTGSVDVAASVAIQPNGKIVAAGQSAFRSALDFALARYNSDGTLDASFGTGGTVTTDFAFANSVDQAFSVAVQRDGKIVAAGSTTAFGGFSDFALARYE